LLAGGKESLLTPLPWLKKTEAYLANPNFKIPARDRQTKHFSNLSFGFNLIFAMNHVRFMISPELLVVQETLTFGISRWWKSDIRYGSHS
jgi:hypothetical protein